MDELATGNNYRFDRNARSSVRLHHNHWLITKHCGYMIHPKISIADSDLRIADIGTGTGIWLIDLAQDLPTSSVLDGFDISAAQYPPYAWLPPNVHLHTHDAFTPFAEEFREKYDIVNMRFWTTILHKEILHDFFKNVITLLKPGGCLQWVDLDPASAEVLRLDSDKSSGETEKVAALMRLSGVGRLDHLKINGLEKVVMDRIKIPQCYRMFWGQSHLMGYEELLSKKVKAEGQSGQALRDSLKAVERLEEELDAGICLQSEYFCLLLKRSSK